MRARADEAARAAGGPVAGHAMLPPGGYDKNAATLEHARRTRERAMRKAQIFAKSEGWKNRGGLKHHVARALEARTHLVSGEVGNWCELEHPATIERLDTIIAAPDPADAPKRRAEAAQRAKLQTSGFDESGAPRGPRPTLSSARTLEHADGWDLPPKAKVQPHEVTPRGVVPPRVKAHVDEKHREACATKVPGMTVAQATGNDGSISIEANKFDPLFTRQARGGGGARRARAPRRALRDARETTGDSSRARARVRPRRARRAAPPRSSRFFLSSRSCRTTTSCTRTPRCSSAPTSARRTTCRPRRASTRTPCPRSSRRTGRTCSAARSTESAPPRARARRADARGSTRPATSRPRGPFREG